MWRHGMQVYVVVPNGPVAKIQIVWSRPIPGHESCTPKYGATEYVVFCTVPHCTALHQIKLHYTVLYCTASHYTTLYCYVLYCTALNDTVLHSTKLHYTVLYCIKLHCTVPHCTTEHDTTRHDTTQHDTVTSAAPLSVHAPLHPWTPLDAVHMVLPDPLRSTNHSKVPGSGKKKSYRGWLIAGGLGGHG